MLWPLLKLLSWKYLALRNIFGLDKYPSQRGLKDLTGTINR